MQNFCVHIFTTHKNHDRCKMIEETYGKHVENLFFYTDRKISNFKYIHCTDRDDYISHVEKNFYAINNAFLSLNKISDWHIFIGDDTFIYHKNLENLLNNLSINDNKIYGHRDNSWNQDPTLHYIGGGPGIIFNTTSLQNFVLNNKYPLSKLNSFLYSDVAIGYICRENNIDMVDVKDMYVEPPEKYSIKNPQDYISFHYIKTKQQFTNLYNHY